MLKFDKMILNKSSIFKIICLLVFTIAGMNVVFAQEQYKPAKLVYMNGDSISCYISNLSSCKEIQVKKEEKGKSEILNANNVKAYTFEGNTFERKIVSITNYKLINNSGVLSKIKDENKGTTSDTIFLKKVVAGKVTLYSVLYSNNENYLFVEKGKEFYELPNQYDEYFIDENTKSQLDNKQIQQVSRLQYTIVKRKDYINVLQVVLNDPGRFDKIPPFEYSENAIIDLVRVYNQRNGVADGGLVNKSIKKRIYFGLNIGSLNPMKDAYFDPKSSSMPLALNLYMLLPMSYNKNVFFKLAYNSYSYMSGQRAIKNVSIGLRRASVQGAIRPYIGADISFGYQYVNSIKSDFELTNSIEAGILVPIKKVNLLTGFVFTPISFEQHGYQFISYSLGILF